jgi:hypothetical protein
MKWALLFWATNPAQYHVHSVYLQDTNCQAQVARYQQIFKQTNAKMNVECRPAREVKLGVKTDVAYIKEVVY